jgi:hypothetical protein
MAGVYRCYPTTNPGDCTLDLQPCSFSDECCCGLCAPDAGGALVCCPGGVDCVPRGGACTADADCCDLHCVDGFCTERDTDCIPVGGPCLADTDCCEGLVCSTVAGTCAFPP